MFCERQLSICAFRYLGNKEINYNQINYNRTQKRISTTWWTSSPRIGDTSRCAQDGRKKAEVTPIETKESIANRDVHDLADHRHVQLPLEGLLAAVPHGGGGVGPEERPDHVGLKTKKMAVKTSHQR